MMTSAKQIKKNDTIAIIGLGRMGHGIARNLIKAGFSLKGCPMRATSLLMI